LETAAPARRCGGRIPTIKDLLLKPLPNSRPDADRAAGGALTFRPSPHFSYTFEGARLVETIDSPYQRIDVWDTPMLGTLFTLDGRPMTSVGDEFIYHECMVHPAALAHPAPRRVLILGGGDGGAARQWLKHPGVERIVVAELDATVVAMARQHLGDVHRGALDDPRVDIAIGDAALFVRLTDERFDAVVFDLTPPDSPASALYTRAFYETLRTRLMPGATLSIHLGSPIFHRSRVIALRDDLRATFRHVAMMHAYVPLYGSPWLMAVASDALDAGALPSEMAAARAAERRIAGLEYYDASRHAALFTQICAGA
jgi:spermidine synthase